MKINALEIISNWLLYAYQLDLFLGMYGDSLDVKPVDVF
jgi:hypothetical protein